MSTDKKDDSIKKSVSSLMEKIKDNMLSNVLEKKVNDLGEDLKKTLSESVCVGYSFYNTSIEKTSANGIVLKCNAGVRLRVGTEEIIVGVDIKYTKCIPQGRSKHYITLDADYRISKGRDLSFTVSDQINFVDGESWTNSLYEIQSTKIIFSEVERMIYPITLNSPMPTF